MDLEIIILSEVSQRHIWYFFYVESKNKKKKKETNELIYKAEKEIKLMVTEGEKVGGGIS